MPLDNKNEFFIWVDERDNILGMIARGEAHDGSGKIHRAVKILVLNHEGTKILFQKRSNTKDTNPGKWSCGVGGHIEPGESYATAARREILEEIGIKISKAHFLHKKLYDLGYEREYMATFETRISETETIALDASEVVATEWCEVESLPQFIATHEMSPEAVEILTEIGYLP